MNVISVQRLLVAVFFLSFSIAPLLRGAEPPRVEMHISAEEACIANGILRMRVPLDAPDGSLSLIEDLRGGAKLPLEGEPFQLEFATGTTVRAADMQLVGITAESSPTAGRLSADYRRDSLSVRLVTELRAGQHWATRWLEISTAQGPDAPRQRLAAISLANWAHGHAVGPSGPGETVEALGYPSGCGQAVYAGGFFCGIAHPGAESFAVDGNISCRIFTPNELGAHILRTHSLVIGVGARREFLRYIDATRAVPSRMLFLVNDWYWRDKSQPLRAIESLVQTKQQSGLPVDSFTLDDGWDFDWDVESGLWGRLNRTRFPGGWDALQAAGRPAEINISLWFGPIGGYGERSKRIAFGRDLDYEIQGDKLCLAAARYRQHVIDSFSQWAARGMDYIKVDGFWPDCDQADHGHAVGPGAAISQMDALMSVVAAWRRSRPDLRIGYTSGSNPSPFWLQHADYIWRGGLDDSHAGAGEPFDRHNTYLDVCLERHRHTEMPMSAFVTFDIVTNRISGNQDEAFERGFWWLAARTSLHHDWYLQAEDLTPQRWRQLAAAAKWAERHQSVFRWSRMVGGSPAQGEIYGFAAFDGREGTLALRNPSLEARSIEAPLANLLELPDSEHALTLKLQGAYGITASLEGRHAATDVVRLELPPLAVAVLEVAADSETGP